MPLNAIRRLWVDIRADTDDAEQGLEDVSDKADVTSESINNIHRRSRALRSAFTALGTGALAAGAGLAVIAWRGAQVEQSLKTMQVTSRATTEQMDAVQAKASQLGSDLPINMNQAANAFREMAFAGFSATEAIDASGAVAEMASASMMDIQQSARVTTSTLNQFSMASDKAGSVANGMASVFSSSAVTMDEMAQSLEYAGAAASTAGQSLTETMAAVGALGDAGLRASKAGVGLQQMFMRIANPTQSAREAMSRINLEVQDFLDKSGDFKDITDMVALLEERMASLSEQERLDVLSEMFGNRGARAVAPLVDSADNLTQKVGEVAASNLAAAIAKMRETSQKELSERSQNLPFELTPQMDRRDVLRRFQKLSEDLNKQDLATKIETGLNVDRRTARVLAGDLIEGKSVADLAAGMERAVTASEIASAKMQTVAGRAEDLLGSLDSLALKMFDTLAPAFSAILGGLTRLTNTIKNIPYLAQAMAVGLGLATTALLTATVAVGAMAAETWAMKIALDAGGLSLRTLSTYMWIYNGAAKAATGANWLLMGSLTAVRGAIYALYSAIPGVGWAAIAASVGIGILVSDIDSLGGLLGATVSLITDFAGAIWDVVEWTGALLGSILELGGALLWLPIRAVIAPFRVLFDLLGALLGGPAQDAVNWLGGFGQAAQGVANAIGGIPATIRSWTDAIQNISFVEMHQDAVLKTLRGIADIANWLRSFNFGDLIPNFDIGTLVPDLSWDSVVPTLRWRQYVPEFRWTGLPTLNWGSLIPDFSWDGVVPSLSLSGQVSDFEWGDVVPNLSLSGLVPNFEWGDVVPNLSLSEWVSEFQWDDVVPSLSLSEWVTGLSWDDIVPQVEWGSYIPSFSWVRRIAKLTWDAFIDFLGWGDYVPKLDWGAFIPDLNLGDKLSVPSLSELAPSGNLTQNIAGGDLGGLIPSLPSFDLPDPSAKLDNVAESGGRARGVVESLKQAMTFEPVSMGAIATGGAEAVSGDFRNLATDAGLAQSQLNALAAESGDTGGVLSWLADVMGDTQSAASTTAAALMALANGDMAAFRRIAQRVGQDIYDVLIAPIEDWVTKLTDAGDALSGFDINLGALTSGEIQTQNATRKLRRLRDDIAAGLPDLPSVDVSGVLSGDVSVGRVRQTLGRLRDDIAAGLPDLPSVDVSGVLSGEVSVERVTQALTRLRDDLAAGLPALPEIDVSGVVSGEVPVEHATRSITRLRDRLDARFPDLPSVDVSGMLSGEVSVDRVTQALGGLHDDLSAGLSDLPSVDVSDVLSGEVSVERVTRALGRLRDDLAAGLPDIPSIDLSGVLSGEVSIGRVRQTLGRLRDDLAAGLPALPEVDLSGVLSGEFGADAVLSKVRSLADALRGGLPSMPTLDLADHVRGTTIGEHIQNGDVTPRLVSLLDIERYLPTLDLAPYVSTEGLRQKIGDSLSFDNLIPEMSMPDLSFGIEMPEIPEFSLPDLPSLTLPEVSMPDLSFSLPDLSGLTDWRSMALGLSDALSTVDRTLDRLFAPLDALPPGLSLLSRTVFKVVGAVKLAHHTIDGLARTLEAAATSPRPLAAAWAELGDIFDEGVAKLRRKLGNLKPWLGAVWEQFSGIVSSGGDKLISATGSVLGGFVGMFGGIGGRLWSELGPVRDAVSGFAAWIEGHLPRATRALRIRAQQLAGVGDYLGGVISDIIGRLPSLEQIGGAVSGALGRAWGELRALGSYLETQFGRSLDYAGGKLADLGSWLEGMAVDPLIGAWNLLAGAGEDAVSLFDQFIGHPIGDFIAWTAEQADRLGAAFDRIVVQGFVNALAWAGRQVDRLGATFDRFVVSPLANALAWAGEKADEFGAAFDRIVVGGAVQMFHDVAGAVGRLGDRVDSLVLDPLRGFGQWIAGGLARAKSAVAGFINWFPSLSDVASFATNLGATIIDQLRVALDVTLASLILPERMLPKVAGFWYRKGVSLVQTLASGVASVPQMLANAVANLLKNVLPFLPGSDAERGPLSNLTERGRGLVQALATGVASSTGALPRALMSALSGVGDWVGRMLSPDNLMSTGQRWLQKGRQLAGSLTSGIQSGVRNIGGMIQGGLDRFTPDISGLLDAPMNAIQRFQEFAPEQRQRAMNAARDTLQSFNPLSGLAGGGQGLPNIGDMLSVGPMALPQGTPRQQRPQRNETHITVDARTNNEFKGEKNPRKRRREVEQGQTSKQDIVDALTGALRQSNQHPSTGP